MSQGDELWSQVVKLQDTWPHTARNKDSCADAKATVQDGEPRTAEVGKEIISILGYAAVTGVEQTNWRVATTAINIKIRET